MKLLNRFKSSQPPDVSELVLETIQTRESWEEAVRSLRSYDPGDEMPPGIGCEESWQLPYPTSYVEQLRAAAARLEATIEEVRGDHPIIWALWSEGSAEEASLDFTSALASLDKPGSGLLTSPEGWRGFTPRSGLLNGFSRWTEPVGDSSERRRFIAGHNPVELLAIEGNRGYFGLELISGDPQEAKALIEASLNIADDPDRRRRLETNLEEIRSSLKSALKEGEQAAAAMSQVFQEGERLYLIAQSEEQDYRERPYRNLADHQVDSLI